MATRYGRKHRRDRERLFAERGPVCQMPGCGQMMALRQSEADGRALLVAHLDHHRPLSKGGKHEDANLRLICERCHNKKSASEKAGKVVTVTSEDGWPIDYGEGWV